MSLLCNEFLEDPRPAQLFRVMAIQKTALPTWVTRGSLGSLNRAVNSYPKLDVKTLSKKLISWSTKASRKETKLSDRVHSSLTKGRISSAGKLVADPSCKIAKLDDEVRQNLRELHPVEAEVKQNGRGPVLEVDYEVLKSSLRQTKTDAAGGPSGFDGNLINVLKHNDAFISFLKEVAKRVFDGRLEPREILLGSRLIPLIKSTSGKLRPIACGEIWFRIIGRAAVRQTNFRCPGYQLGVGTKLGVEPLLELLRSKSRNRTIVALDLENAFNRLNREFMMKEAKRCLPDLWNLIRWSYEKHSRLYFGDGTFLTSESGVRQGDPLGPLLFSVAYAKVLRQLIKELNDGGILDDLSVMAYLDDTYLTMKPELEARAKSIAINVFSSMQQESGLRLRQDKSWTASPESIRDIGIKVLGSHIGANQDKFLEEWLLKFEEQIKRLALLRSQDAMIVLRRSLVPQMNNLLRTLEVTQQNWRKVDRVLIEFVKLLASKSGSKEEFNEVCLTLPIRFGGLGITLPSFIHETCRSSSRQASLKYLDNLAPGLGLSIPDSGSDGQTQREILSEKWTELRLEMLKRLPQHKAIAFMENSSVLGSRWLHSLPIKERFTINDLIFCGALADRLLIAEVEGSHKATQIWRHEQLKKAIKTGFEASGCVVVVEPPEENGSTRGDLNIRGRAVEGRVVVDLSVVMVSSAAASAANNHRSAQKPMTAHLMELISNGLRKRYSQKMKKYQGKTFAGRFVPWILTSGGVMHDGFEEAIDNLKRPARRAYDEMLWEMSFILMEFRSRVCFNKMIRQ